MLSLVLTVLLFASSEAKLSFMGIVSNPFSYVYFIWFNLMTITALRIDAYWNKVMPWEHSKSRRLVVELMTIFIIILAFFYITIVTVGFIRNVENPFRLNAFSITVGIFSSLVLIFFVSFLISQNFLHNWQASITRLETLKKEKMESEYNALQAQLNPHFLFNSLNVLISEIDYNPQEAKAFALNLSHVYRFVLQSKDKTLVTLEEEWKAAHAFLDLHLVRLGDGLQFELDDHSANWQGKLPPLSLQILFENAIKHNVATIKKPLKLQLIFKENDLVVSNNLQKGKTLYSMGIGLEALTNRYKFLNAEKIPVILETKEDFKVTLPLLK
ncbi:sensor histidine kinase [Persicobacter diffluens]|uniref:sensor histidine kinase n=1 Tax=Persicobacter diffluens TaxID=981 RepID=UPI0030C693F2